MEIVLALISTIPALATLIVSIINNKRISNFDNLKNSLEKYELTQDKRFLVSEMSDIKQGVEKNEQQKALIHEAFDEYKELGGNSYVESMHGDLVRAGKL